MQLINTTGTHQYIIGTILFLFKLGQPGQRRQLQPSISSHGGHPKSTYWNKKTLSSLLQNSSGSAQWNWLVIQSPAGTSFHGVLQRSRFLLPVSLLFWYVLQVPYIPRNYEKTFWSKPVEAHTSHPSTLYKLNTLFTKATSWIDRWEEERAQGTLKGFPGQMGIPSPLQWL